MPDITELLDRGAPDAGGPAPTEAIIRRGRRRRMATRTAVVGVPLAAAAVVLGIVMAGGTPTGVVVDPPTMMDSPSPTPSESPTDDLEPTPSTPEPDDGGGTGATAPQGEGWVAPAGLAADALVVSADGGTPTVSRYGADGGVKSSALEAGVPNAAGMVPDAQGGFTWQPDWESAGLAPILHMDAGGDVRTLVDEEEPRITLVGRDHGRGQPLITRTWGDTPEEAMGDLLTLPLDGDAPTGVRSDVVAWETGVAYAASLEVALYAQYVEAMQNLVLDPPDAGPHTVFEGGEATGEYIGGVGIIERGHLGVALVGGVPGLDETPDARLLFVELASGEIVNEVEVPLDGGFEGSEQVGRETVARDVSTAGSHVLVNRKDGGEWIVPLIYDTVSEEWSVLQHREAGVITTRATLAPSAPTDPAVDAAACVTEDAELLNSAPDSGDDLYLYVPCKDAPEAGDVYRLPADVQPRGQVEQDLQAVLERLIQPVIDEDLADRGYYFPADRGQPVLQSVDVEADGAAVVGFDFPNGVGNLSTSYAGAMWHQSLLGTVFQFEKIETVESASTAPARITRPPSRAPAVGSSAAPTRPGTARTPGR